MNLLGKWKPRMREMRVWFHLTVLSSFKRPYSPVLKGWGRVVILPPTYGSKDWPVLVTLPQKKKIKNKKLAMLQKACFFYCVFMCVWMWVWETCWDGETRRYDDKCYVLSRRCSSTTSVVWCSYFVVHLIKVGMPNKMKLKYETHVLFAIFCG